MRFTLSQAKLTPEQRRERLARWARKRNAEVEASSS
jgi:hypothetical protein